MDSLFTSFLIGYSFSVTVSTITLLIGAAYLKQLVSSRHPNNLLDEKLGENIEVAPHHEPSKFKPHDEKLEENDDSPMHMSFRHKSGLAVFVVGITVIIASNLIFSQGTHTSVTTRLVGIFISILSSFFGVLFHWVFAYYSKKNLYRIIEFLMCLYFFAALSITIICALIVDRSSYKHMSLVGWIYYAKNSIGWIV